MAKATQTRYIMSVGRPKKLKFAIIANDDSLF